MTVVDLRKSLTAAEPPAELTLALVGLWWDAKGDWTRAHETAQQDEGSEGGWAHAYVFVPKSWRLRSVEVGSFGESGANLSDHVPMVVEVNIGGSRR